MSVEENELYKKIDNDEGLHSKRKSLTILSLILLAIEFSGTKIIEANTFIFKLKFDNQNGIALLLVFCILFLLIRYHNYARHYHDILYQIWSKELLRNISVNHYCEHFDELSGLLHEKYPDHFDPENFRHSENITYSYDYECHGFFKRRFRYNWSDENSDNYDFIDIGTLLGIQKYLMIIKIEFKCQFSRYFTHRENLDILAPYILGVIAIISFVFNKQFQSVLKLILS